MNKNMLLVGSVVLIILAIGMVAILDKAGSAKDTATGDVRARAATAKTLMMNGKVVSVDDAAGTLTVNNVFLADVSRSGDAKDLGTWVVTPPSNFSLSSLAPGASVTIGVDAKTFLASKHTMTAVTVVATSK